MHYLSPWTLRVWLLGMSSSTVLQYCIIVLSIVVIIINIVTVRVTVTIYNPFPPNIQERPPTVYNSTRTEYKGEYASCDPNMGGYIQPSQN